MVTFCDPSLKWLKNFMTPPLKKNTFNRPLALELVQIKHSNCHEQAIYTRASLKLSKQPEGQDKVQINYILLRCV